MKITIVAGARPNFMKIAPLIREIKKLGSSEIQFRLVHTGQHYDEKMSQAFFKDLDLPEPDVNLGAGAGTQAEQTARIMIEFEKDLGRHPTDLVIVVGDVTSTLACTIVAKKMNTRVAHVEAGIRSFDMSMPEEINRMVTDALADYFFTTSEFANENLVKSGVDKSKIFYVGNIMIDTLIWSLDKLKRPVFANLNIDADPYCLLTLHRPSNVDSKSNFDGIIREIARTVRHLKVVFPAHPRTVKVIGNQDDFPENFIIIEPLGYLEFIYLLKGATMVITDSGGVQEETTYLRIPCLTLRSNTERPETVTLGTNELIGNDWTKFEQSTNQILSGNWKTSSIPKYWDGGTAERIVGILLDKIFPSELTSN